MNEKVLRSPFKFLFLFFSKIIVYMCHLFVRNLNHVILVWPCGKQDREDHRVLNRPWASADFQSADKLFFRSLQAPSHVYPEWDILFCVCDSNSSITEVSCLLCAARCCLQTMACFQIWLPPSVWRNPRGPWAQPSYRVGLKDQRHVQLRDIMVRRGGRCFTTAVTGQLLSEGVQQLT